MYKEYIFMTEDGKQAVVKYEIRENFNEERAYGIAAKLIMDGYEECEEVDNLFFTKEEAEKTAEMLAKHKVTPCTLKDILLQKLNIACKKQ